MCALEREPSETDAALLEFFLLPISKGSVTLVEETLVHKLRM